MKYTQKSSDHHLRCMLSTLTRCSLKGLKTVPLHACLAMSRTPSPDHWHPAVDGMAWRTPSPDHWHPQLGGRPGKCPCASFTCAPHRVHPRALGRFVALTRLFCPSNRLQTSIDAFLGWLLEAFTMPMQENRPLRQHLRAWQLQLRGNCRNARLKWHEAFAIYGLDLELA